MFHLYFRTEYLLKQKHIIMSLNPRVDSAITNGYEFKLGQYFSKGFEIFKKNPGGFIIFTIVSFLISAIISFIPFIGSIIGIFISPCLSVGNPIAAHLLEKKNDQEFGNFFKGFEHLGQLVVSYLLILVIIIVLFIPFLIVVGLNIVPALINADSDAIESIFSEIGSSSLIITTILLFLAVVIYVSVCIRWAYFFVVFHKYDAVEAIKASWKIVHKRWFAHFGFIIVAILMVLGGLIALIVGIVFVYPVIQAADYAAFAEITGLNKDDDAIDEIGQKSYFV